MRLDFNILWVEDQPAQVEAQMEKIRLSLRKYGFRVNAKSATSVEEAGKFLGDSIFGDHIDLILMDYDLGEGPNGSEGIDRVRDVFAYKDIVFYTAGSMQTLKGALSEGNLQGIFYSSRQELTTTVVGVFETLVKKVLDIEHSRGIVMGATSEIDNFVIESLLAAFAQADDARKTKALDLIRNQGKENRKTLEKELKKIELLKDLDELPKFHHIFTSVHRLRLLRKMLEAMGTHAAECESMIQYVDKTVPRRNELAHVRVEREGFSRKLYDRDNKEVTIEDVTALLVELLDYHELFEGVKNALHGPTKENK
jgi:CheY-like chemotaxis protein